MPTVIDLDYGSAKRKVLLSCLMSVGGGCCEQDQLVYRGRTMAVHVHCRIALDCVRAGA